MKTKNLVQMTAFLFAITTSGFVQAKVLLKEKVTCYNKEDHSLYGVFYENSPEGGLVTSVGSDGHKTILQLNSSSVEIGSGGCMVHEEVKKTYFHPYYQIDLTGVTSVGSEGTRCAGMYREKYSLQGFVHAEMQEPKALVCDSEVETEVFP